MTHARISPREAARLIDDEGYVPLDVRTEAEFALGHPKGAFNVPFLIETESGRVENPLFVKVIASVFARNVKIVVSCHTGSRSQPASAALIAAGYATVVEQRAGFAGARDAFGRLIEKGWQAEGLACVDRAEAGHDYASLHADTTTDVLVFRKDGSETPPGAGG